MKILFCDFSSTFSFSSSFSTYPFHSDQTTSISIESCLESTFFWSSFSIFLDFLTVSQISAGRSFPIGLDVD
jgi:hypothetical protein